MAEQLGADPDVDVATRKGELAMLINSIGPSSRELVPKFSQFSAVSVAAGTLLPTLARRDRRLLLEDVPENPESESLHLQNSILEWRDDAARKGKTMKIPRMPFLLRNIWTGALLLFTLLTTSTYWVSTVTQVCLKHPKKLTSS